MIGGLGYVMAPGNAANTLNTVAAKDVWVRPMERARAEALTVPSVELPTMTGAGTQGVTSPRVLSDLFWMGRYGERAENLARLLMVTRERYHEFRHRQDTEESECVPVLLTALGRITGTDTGADDDHHEMIAVAPSTLWALTMDRELAGSLAQSVEGLGLRRPLGARPTVQRHLARAGRGRARRGAPLRIRRTRLPRATLCSRPASSKRSPECSRWPGVAAESMVHDVGWTMMDIGKRIERAWACPRCWTRL